MNTRPSWFWTSLFTSIGVNAVLFVSACAWLYSQTPIYLAGYPRSSISTGIYVSEPMPIIRDTILGDASGTGDATDASPGETPMESFLSGQTQAFMSRDPEGPGKIAKDPAMSTQMPGENGNGEDGAPMFGAAMAQATPPQPRFAPAVPAEPAPERAMQPKAENPETAKATPAETKENEATAEATEKPEKIAQQPTPAEAEVDEAKIAQTVPPAEVERDPTEIAQSNPPAEAGAPPTQLVSIAEAAMPALPPSPPPTPPANPAPQSAGGGKPGPSAPAADPAPKTESESDPFAKNGAVKFKRGSTDVQFGRKHKIIRPQLGLGAQTALLNLTSPITVTLALTLDEKGNVISVIVIKSSGSKDVDQAVKVAAYKWWMEPTRDKSGKAVKDVVPFTVGFS